MKNSYIKQADEYQLVLDGCSDQAEHSTVWDCVIS